MRFFNVYLAISILIFFANRITAQKIDEDEISRLREVYPESQVIFLKYIADIDVSVKGDSLYVEKKNFENTFYLGSQVSQFAKDRIYSSSFYELKDIEAYSLVPSGRRYKKANVSSFKESFNKNSDFFYDDFKTINFVFPGIEQNAQSVLSYTEIYEEPRFGDKFFFQSGMPLDYARFSVTVDEKIDIEISKFNFEGYDIKVTEEKLKGDRIRYTFESKEIQKWETESNSQGISFYAPHVVFRIKSFVDSQGVTHRVLDDLNDLFAWYSDFVGDLATKKDLKIQEVVDELISEDDTEIDKVRKIYYWVQDNIKYIAFEDGMRGFIPHSGAYVCEKRYGDCKDMASIIVNMLHHAGIKAHFTWVGTRSIPYKYTELPTTMVDNHMIATYKSGEDYYFLDATAQYLPFPLPSSMIQGKETLIKTDDGFEIVEVPEIGYEENVMNDTIRIKLDESTIFGKGNVSLSGYAKLFNAFNLIQSDEKSVSDYLNYLLAKGNNKFLIDDYDIANLYNRDLPIEVDYSFNLSDYYRNINDDIYINLNLDRAMDNFIFEKDRKLPYENRFRYTNKIVTILEKPEGYELSYLPENITFENDLLAFTISYNEMDGEIIMDKTLKVKYLTLQPDEFDEHNKAVKELNKAYREAIVLSKK
ncbi:DUF3857 domain-containing protein [Mangrovivirga sp. M17]|uniref:DUF3857 domain-containing protein n=1 Tax=Mangrovivirga halotolerans TaxID=2993936 RepID=A0ABT3RNB0_9BACT|nr:DUF3857 domain-containing protein [Mangrovivirga halotolerans]MCX2743085.1 DUF3857 domain-containing protein [Mangrovivirga halotolerans]